MGNLTLTIDDELLKRARMRALERNTSVNALVREYLQGLAGENPADEGIRAFLDIAQRGGASSGAGGRSWTRDELHAR